MITIDKFVKRYFIAAASFFVLFVLFAKLHNYSEEKNSIVKKMQEEYNYQHSAFSKTATNIFQALQIDSLLRWDNLSTLINDKNVGCYILKNDSLWFWNKNEISLQNIAWIDDDNTGIYHFEHGWYFGYRKSEQKWKIVLYKIIQYDYSISNQYLQGGEESTGYYETNISFSVDTLATFSTIKNNEGKAVVGIIHTKQTRSRTTTTNVLFYLWLGGWLFIELIVLRLYVILLLRLKIYWRITFVFLDIVFLLLIIGQWFIPDILLNTFWFEYWHPILPFINSRGMVVLFVSMFLIMTFYFGKTIKIPPKQQEIRKIEVFCVSFVQFLLIFFILFVFYRFYGFTLKPHDNAIGFLFRRDIIELYSVSGLVISLFLLQYVLLKALYVNTMQYLSFVFYSLIFSLLFFSFIKLPPLFYVAVFLTQILFLLILKFTARDPNFIFLRYLILTVLMALTFSVIINNRYSILKNEFQLQIVHQLTVNRDKKLERKFYSVAEKIKNDKRISVFIKSKVPEETIKEYLYKSFFEHQFGNYFLQLTICHDSDLLEVNSDGNLVNCKQYFRNIRTEPANKPIDSSLVLIYQEAESRYYLGDIYLGKDSLTSFTLFIEMFSTIVPSGFGYPELLVDNSNQIDLTGYSIAKYHHNQLVYKVGEYDYHGSYSVLQSWPNDHFFYLNKYLHYKLRLNSSDVLVVSRPGRSYAGQIATFSFLFLLFSFLAVLLYIISTGRKQLSLFKYSFRTRLQFFIMGTLMVLFVLMSAISAYYFNDIKKALIVNQLNEKSKSVLTELQDKFTKEEFESISDKDYLQQQLQKFSIIFFTDINIYKRSGELLATSRPKIFEAGLLSNLINPEGYKQIIKNQKIFYLTREQIGKMSYYSAYVPLSFGSDASVAILNLPYFARQTEVLKSFMPLVYNYLNIFVLLGILGTFMALMISKILTRPLTMLQQSLSEIQIDKKNEPLVWNNDDEIGQLISEYNLMVKKIEDSAGLLKRSEREMAWREMAQQVAHEIRNPLTPMKLNIQYLQKVYNESKPDFNEKWKSLSVSLIDQIEALSEVATVFSELATNNLLDKEKIDVIQLVSSAIDTYKNYDKISIEFKSNVQEAFVMARQNELLRVLNNLLKNAVQSILPNEGKIKIEVLLIKDLCQIIISDTGRGIPEEMKERIFQPYFTTKSGGTGVGLAIVKNIITEMGGEINFTSSINRGTRFVLRLKSMQQ